METVSFVLSFILNYNCLLLKYRNEKTGIADIKRVILYRPTVL